MPVAFIAEVDITGTGGYAGPTADIDTTGADLIVAAVHHATGATIAFGDNKSNTYTALTGRVGSVSGVRLYYKLSPTVGSGHNFTVTGSNIYAVISIAAFSGIDAYDKENGTTGTGTTISPGSVTPAAADSVLFAALTGDQSWGGSVSIGSSFTKTSDYPYTGGSYMGASAAYKIRTTAAAENPAWSGSSVNSLATAIAVFTGPGGGGGPTAFPWTNLYRQYSA